MESGIRRMDAYKVFGHVVHEKRTQTVLLVMDSTRKVEARRYNDKRTHHRHHLIHHHHIMPFVANVRSTAKQQDTAAFAVCTAV